MDNSPDLGFGPPVPRPRQVTPNHRCGSEVPESHQPPDPHPPTGRVHSRGAVQGRGQVRGLAGTLGVVRDTPLLSCSREKLDAGLQHPRPPNFGRLAKSPFSISLRSDFRLSQICFLRY